MAIKIDGAKKKAKGEEAAVKKIIKKKYGGKFDFQEELKKVGQKQNNRMDALFAKLSAADYGKKDDKRLAF